MPVGNFKPCRLECLLQLRCRPVRASGVDLLLFLPCWEIFCWTRGRRMR